LTSKISNGNGRSLVSQSTLADTVAECQGQLWLAAFEGIKPGDVTEIVENTIKRAKEGNIAATRVVLNLLGQVARPGPKTRSKEFPPAPSRPVAALGDDDEDEPAPAGNGKGKTQPDRVKVTKKNYDQVAVDKPLRFDRLALARSIMKASGAKVLLSEVQNSLGEENLDCTLEEFEAIYQELFPPAEDWKRPLT